MALVSMFKRKGAHGYGYDSSAEEVTLGLDLSDKTVLVTGCSSGLGLETLRVLALRGARVLGSARSLDKARAACAAVAPQALPLVCELSEPASVLACAEAVRHQGTKLDGIICNAGTMALPKLAQAFGYELQFFTNHIGHFLLVTSLLDQLSERARVVVVSSDAHRLAPRQGIEFDNLSGERGYNAWTAYGQSKLANLLFARELALRLPHKTQSANALHPGVIATNLQRSMPGFMRGLMALGQPLFLKTVPQGAATQCYVVAHPGMQETGAYFVDCQPRAPRKLALDPALAKRLWEESERIVASVT